MTLPVTWPAIGFEVIPNWDPRPDYAIYMDTDWYFGSMTRRQFKGKDWQNMLVVDSAGRSFRVLNAVKEGYAESFLWWLVLNAPRYRIRYELAEVPTMPFEDLLELLCNSIEAWHSGWYDDSRVVGDTPDRIIVSEEDQIAAQIAALRRCENLSQLFQALQNQPY